MMSPQGGGLYTPVETTTVDTITLGGLILSFDQLADIRREIATIASPSANTFISFNSFQVPADFVLIIGNLIIEAGSKDSVRFGYDDDGAGTNFVQLIDENILTPSNTNSGSSDFVFTIPTAKFPSIEVLKANVTGFMIFEGIVKSTSLSGLSVLVHTQV